MDDDTVAFKTEIDVYHNSFATFERLCNEIRDTAYEFVLTNEQNIHADQLGDVKYDESALQTAFDDDSVDYTQLEVIVEIESADYADDLARHQYYA